MNPLKAPIDYAHEFRAKSPSAGIREIKEYAESVSDQPEFVLAVVREIARLTTAQAQSQADVDRIWPEEKGY